MAKKKEKEEEKKEDQEFKPVAPTEQTSEQKKLVAMIREHWSSDPCVKKEFPSMHEWEEWFYGNQYAENINGQLIDLTPMVARQTKNVYNRTMPTVRQIWGELRYPHEFYAEPVTLEKDDIKTAKIAGNFAEHTNDIGSFKYKIDMGKLLALIHKYSYWKEWWNASSSKSGTIRNPETGKRSKEPGECDYNYIPAFNCRPDPLGTTKETWRHFIEGQPLPKSKVEKEFKLAEGALPTEKVDKYTTGPDAEDTSEGIVIRKEYWEKGTPSRPKGRFVVEAGGWLLYDGPNPAHDYSIPYWRLPGLIPDIRKPGEYESAVKILRPIQKGYNRVCSQIDEHLETYDIKGLIPFGSVVGGELKAWKRPGIEYVEYNPRIGPPYFQNPPPVPEAWISQRDFYEKAFETVISVRKITMADWPKGVRASGVLFEGFKHQDEIVLMPTVEEYDNILPDILKYRLGMVKKHYSERRMIRTVGKNRKISISFFKGADLTGDEDIKVKPGVELFTNRRIKYDAVMVMMEKGLITEPRKALELLDLGKGLEEYMEDEFVDEQQASRYLEVMKTTDQVIEVDPDDNNDVHFKIFNNFRKSQEFETLPEENQQAIRDRIEALKALMTPEEGASPRPEPAPAPEAEAIPAEVPAMQMTPEQILAEIMARTQGSPTGGM